MWNARPWAALTFLWLASTYFCHRLYGVWMPLEGDALLHIYFRLHEPLLTADYNPHQWYFMGFLPFAGRYNPVVQGVGLLVGFFFPEQSATAQALITCCVSSWALLTLVSWSAYFCFRYLGHSAVASTLAATAVTFTGFHLCGVREFNHMFLWSYVFVWPVFCLFLRLQTHKASRVTMAAAALAMGASFWGGTNAPLYYYIPFLMILPLFAGRWRHWVKTIPLQVATILGSLVVGAVVLVPGMKYVGEMNRGDLAFHGSGFTLGEKIVTAFLRDWWRTKGWAYHETDYFLGLPIILLALGGLWTAFGRRAVRSETPVVDRFLVFLLGAAIVVSHREGLPEWLGNTVAWPFTRLSISNADRFFLLALLPIGHFAARGWDNLKMGWVALVAISLLFAQGALVARVLAPTTSVLYPSTVLSAVASMVMMLFAVLLILRAAALRLPPTRWCPSAIATLAAIFLSYAWGVNQLTGYGWDRRYTWGKEELLSQPLHWKSFLGFRANYARALTEVEPIFQHSPRYLKESWTREGRVLMASDLVRPFVQRGHYHAPATGHEFAFTQLFDPATPKRVAELGQNVTPAIMDLAGICTVVLYQEKGPPLATEARWRPSCFPKAFVVQGAKWFRDDHAVLTAMQSATREDFQSHLYLRCASADCEIPQSETVQIDPTAFVRVASREPSEIQLEVQSRQPGFAFVSIPYRGDWSAYQDGVAVEVLRANHAFLAIPIRPGTHTITLQLTRSAQRWGLGISVIASGLLLSLLLPIRGLRFAHPQPQGARAYSMTRVVE